MAQDDTLGELEIQVSESLTRIMGVQRLPWDSETLARLVQQHFNAGLTVPRIIAEKIINE